MEELLQSVLGSERHRRAGELHLLKESFIELDVIKPLKQRGVLRSADPHKASCCPASRLPLCSHPLPLPRGCLLPTAVAKTLAHRERFSLKHFVKVRQRDPMLNDGKLDHYLQKYATKIGVEAIKEKILSRASDQHSLGAIKNLIEENREPVREEWRDLMQSGLQNFFGDQVGCGAPSNSTSCTRDEGL